MINSENLLRSNYAPNISYSTRFQNKTYYKTNISNTSPLKVTGNFSNSFSLMNNSCLICGQSINNNRHRLIQAPDGKILFYPSKQCLDSNNTSNISFNNPQLNFAKYNNLNNTEKNKNDYVISIPQVLGLIEKYPKNSQNLEEKLLEIGAELYLRNKEGFEYLKNLIDEAEKNNKLNKNTKTYEYNDPIRKRIYNEGMNNSNNINDIGRNNFELTPKKIVELIKNNPVKYDNLKKLLLEKGIEPYMNTPEGKKDIRELIEVSNTNILNEIHKKDGNEKNNDNDNENLNQKTQNIDSSNQKNTNNLNNQPPNTFSSIKKENDINKDNKEFGEDYNILNDNKLLKNKMKLKEKTNNIINDPQKDYKNDNNLDNNINNMNPSNYNNDNNNNENINNDYNIDNNYDNENNNNDYNNDNNYDNENNNNDDNNDNNDNNDYNNNYENNNNDYNNNYNNNYENNNNNYNNGFENNNDYNNGFEKNNEGGYAVNNNNIKSNNDDNEQNNKDGNYIEGENYNNFQNNPNRNNNDFSITKSKIIWRNNDINNIKGKLFTIQEAEELEQLNPELAFEYEYIGNKKKIKLIKKRRIKKKYPEGKGSKFSRPGKNIAKSGKKKKPHLPYYK